MNKPRSNIIRVIKIVTCNVGGICSPSKLHVMWKSILNSQWDILFVVEHKEHVKSRFGLQCKQCNVFYVGVNRGLYPGIMLIVRDSLQPVVVQRDVDGRFLVV